MESTLTNGLVIGGDKAAARLSDCIDHAFVINLAHRVDRRVEMEEELQRIGLDDSPWVEFFAAVAPSELAGFPSLGARGCFLSHLGILRTAIHRGYQSIVVMEDDLAISPDLLPQQAAIAQQLQSQDWAIAYLGHAGISVDGLEAPLAPYTGGVACSHFYAIREPYLSSFATFLEQVLQRPPGHPEGGPMHFDGALCMWREATGARTLVTVPNLGTQRSSRSDINPRWIDTAFGVRHLVQVLRTVRKKVRG